MKKTLSTIDFESANADMKYKSKRFSNLSLQSLCLRCIHKLKMRDKAAQK